MLQHQIPEYLVISGQLLASKAVDLESQSRNTNVSSLSGFDIHNTGKFSKQRH